MMSDKDKTKKSGEILRMVEESKPDGQFGYIPPSMKAKMETRRETKKDIEERGYVPPKKARPTSGSDSKKGGDK